MNRSHLARAWMSGMVAVSALVLVGCAAAPVPFVSVDVASGMPGESGTHRHLEGDEDAAGVAALPTGDIGHGTVTSTDGTTGSVRFSTDGTALDRKSVV